MPYRTVDSAKLIIRDHLAIDRTLLANERTALAYVRTVLMLLVSSITAVKLLSDSALMVALGYCLLPLAAGVAVFGFFRTRRMAKSIALARRPTSGADSSANQLFFEI